MIPLLFLSQTDPTDTVPVNLVTMAEVLENGIRLRIVREDGSVEEKLRAKSNFLMMQIKEYGIENFAS
jgi:hypothetical protein